MTSILAKRATSSLLSGPADFCILASASAIAWAFCLELTGLVFYTFRRWSGLYFYALLISSWGCTFHAIGWTLKYLTNASNVAFLIIVEIGWVSMVTGQSVVLYSRLHLVVRNRRILRPVLIMIITNAICMHGPTILFTIASNSIDDPHWNTRLGIMERIQLPIFCVQESIISIIYIVSTIRLLASTSHTKTRKVMRLLVTINAACVSMDAILIGLEYSNGYATETSIKALLYAIKLKLEFAVLNQLMNLAHHGFTEGSRWGLPERESSARRSYEPPPVKDTATEIDTERYKTSNLTGWPRGRLFNNPLVKRPSVPNEHTINSPISQKEGLQVIYELEASKDASTSRPHPPMIPKQHFPSGYLSMSGRDKKEPDAIWSLRED